MTPMLAYTYSGEDLSGPLYVQPKLDGIRCLITKDGMFTRNNKPITSCPHIRESLKSFFEDNPGTTLDGELYNHKYKDDFNKITSLVRRKEYTEECKEVQFWAYDSITSPECIFSKRFKVLEAIKDFDFIVLTPTYLTEDILEYKENFIKDGYEGLMLRTNGLYEFKRSRNLYKVKDFDTEEFELLDLIEGKGAWAGSVKSAILLDKDGTEFPAGIRGDKEFHRQLLKNKEGFLKDTKKSTVRFFGRTPAGRLRFPIVIDIQRDE